MSTSLAPPPPALETPPYPVHRFSVAEYHRLVETGLLDGRTPRGGLDCPQIPRSPLHDANVAVVEGPASRYRDHHPSSGEILLIVEVADSSLTRDRRKASIYASIDVPNYWIIDLQERSVEVRTQPESHRRRYGSTTVHRTGETIDVHSGNQLLATLLVDDLFA